MKRLAIAAAFAAAALSATSASADTSYIDGEAYLKFSADQRYAYIVGVADMLERMADAVDNTTEKAFLDRTHRCMADKTGAQLRDFIDAYMALDPAYRGYSMASNFRAALNEKCPP